MSGSWPPLGGGIATDPDPLTLLYQYLPLDGSGAMEGSLNMGGQSIVSTDDFSIWVRNTQMMRFTDDTSINYITVGPDGDGIVTTTPVRLGVNEDPTDYVAQVNGDGSFDVWAAGSSAGRSLVFRKSRNAAVGSHTIVQNGDTLGVMRGYGSDGSIFIEAARIEFEVDNAPGSNDMPGRIMFSTTADGGVTPTDRMKIGADGVVAIHGTGTSTSPILTNNDDFNTGLSFTSADILDLIAGGVQMVSLIESTNDQVAVGPAGTATVPSLSWVSDLDTGLSNTSADVLDLVAGGVQMLSLIESTNDQIALGPTGSTTVPSLTQVSDLNTGLAWSAADTLSFVAGGSEIFSITSTKWAESAYTAPTLLNSWANHTPGTYASAGYLKAGGRVYLKGLLKNGSPVTAVMFTLPTGYRPATQMYLTSGANNAYCLIVVNPNGDVNAGSGGSASWTSLDGLSFHVG